MPTLIPNLWFDDNALEAAEFYCSVFPDSTITKVTRYTSANADRAGQVATVEWELQGLRFIGINGGPVFTPDEAFSIAVRCADQAESDRYWDALLAGGGEESMCSWLKDRFGISWQVYPAELDDLVNDPDPERAARATAAMYTMRRIDLEAIRAAADGVSA